MAVETVSEISLQFSLSHNNTITQIHGNLENPCNYTYMIVYPHRKLSIAQYTATIASLPCIAQ